MATFKLKPSEYYTFNGGTNGIHCRRCNEVLQASQVVELAMSEETGEWQKPEAGQFSESFGSACAKAALQGR